jgi:quercetin dioxygenase-like cupin family protein
MSDQNSDHPSAVRRVLDPGRWEATAIHAYKDDGAAPFRDVTRQVLFSDANLAAELRYFEVAPSGWSTLERHQHVHAVMIHRGEGRCLVGAEVRNVAVGDLVFIPPMTWHQFRAAPKSPLGFLCMVNAARDKPQLPTDTDLATLHGDTTVSAFLRGV